MKITYPKFPHNSGRLTACLTTRNYSKCSLLRHFNNDLLSLVSVVNKRYWDRGAGVSSPGLGGGSWVEEGSIWLRPYPLQCPDQNIIPAIGSAAGQSYEGKIAENPVLGTCKQKSEYFKRFKRSLWSLNEALNYASSKENTLISENSVIVDPEIFSRNS